MVKNEYLDEILDFLSLTHPSLLEVDGSCVEIRPIIRDGVYDYQRSKSLNLFNLNEKSIERLNDFLNFHQGQRTCIYYSIFAYDYDKEAFTKTGKKAVKGKITSEAALFTEEIVLDFDDINEEEFDKLLIRFVQLDLDALWVFTGHGYHAHILLDKPNHDKEILNKVVNAMYKMNFPVDVNCIDSARVMRLPYTMNNKKEPILAEVVEENAKRYSIEEINEKLQIKEEQLNKTKNQNIIKTINYLHLDNIELPEPIKLMLARTEEGYRNAAMGFLIKFFKQYMKMSKYKVKDILSLWSKSACKPSFDQEFEQNFERLFLMGGLNYTSELAKKFGIIDFDNLMKIQKKKDIFIPNNIFKNLEIIDGKQLRAYLAIKILEHTDKPTTAANIAEVLGITERAVFNCLTELCKNKFIYKVKGNRVRNESYKYQTTKIFEISAGYSKLSHGDLKFYLDTLNGNELKLYLFMSYKCFSSSICYISQTNLGDTLNLKQNTISKLMKSLEEKSFINIRKEYITKQVHHCIYTLLM